MCQTGGLGKCVSMVLPGPERRITLCLSPRLSHRTSPLNSFSAGHLDLLLGLCVLHSHLSDFSKINIRSSHPSAQTLPTASNFSRRKNLKGTVAPRRCRTWAALPVLCSLRLLLPLLGTCFPRQGYLRPSSLGSSVNSSLPPPTTGLKKHLEL